MRALVITTQITRRESESLDKYLQEISKEELITAEEEVLLAKKIQKGDQLALEKLCKANLRFVVSVAKQYQGRGLILSDLINEGNLGLIKAAQRFDETRGFKFISYAVWWIRQSIIQALADQAQVFKFPLNKVAWNNKIKRASSILEQKLERNPSPKEIADALLIPEDRIQNIINASALSISLDSPLKEDEEGSFLDYFPDDNAHFPDRSLMIESIRLDIKRALSTVSEREREIIFLFYGMNGGYGMTYQEIGEKFNLTDERVRQILCATIRRLKNTKRSKILKKYLG